MRVMQLMQLMQLQQVRQQAESQDGHALTGSIGSEFPAPGLAEHCQASPDGSPLTVLADPSFLFEAR